MIVWRVWFFYAEILLSASNFYWARTFKRGTANMGAPFRLAAALSTNRGGQN